MFAKPANEKTKDIGNGPLLPKQVMLLQIYEYDGRKLIANSTTGGECKSIYLNILTIVISIFVSPVWRPG